MGGIGNALFRTAGSVAWGGGRQREPVYEAEDCLLWLLVQVIYGLSCGDPGQEREPVKIPWAAAAWTGRVLWQEGKEGGHRDVGEAVRVSGAGGSE